MKPSELIKILKALEKINPNSDIGLHLKEDGKHMMNLKIGKVGFDSPNIFIEFYKD